MLYEAGVLTLVGMTTVFGFLGLMVCLMHISSKLIARFPGAPEVAAVQAPASAASSDDAHIAAVLAIIASERGEV